MGRFISLMMKLVGYVLTLGVIGCFATSLCLVINFVSMFNLSALIQISMWFLYIAIASLGALFVLASILRASMSNKSNGDNDES